MVIASFLSRRGIKVNYVFIRVLILKYIHQYRKITMQEKGRPGPWFYSFVISMNLALVFAIVRIVLIKSEPSAMISKLGDTLKPCLNKKALVFES